MSVWRTVSVAVAAAALLTACASSSDDDEVKAKPSRTSSSTSRHHESPAPTPVEQLPAGSFDQAKARAELAQAQALRQGGDDASARAYAEAAADHWPALQEAWAELQAACHAQGDKVCERDAQMMHDKIAFVATQPPRMAMLGFQTMADQPPPKPGKKEDGLDAWTVAKARRAAAFYNVADPVAALRNAPLPKRMSDSAPSDDTILAGTAAIGAAVIIIKEVK